MIFKCLVCEYTYDESEGCERSLIPAGTKVEDLPDDWTCPDCGVGKEYLMEFNQKPE